MRIEKILTNAMGGTIVYIDQGGNLQLYNFFSPKTVKEAKFDLQQMLFEKEKKEVTFANPEFPPPPLPGAVSKPKPLKQKPPEEKVEEPDFAPFQPEGDLAEEVPQKRRGRAKRNE